MLRAAEVDAHAGNLISGVAAFFVNRLYDFRQRRLANRGGSSGREMLVFVYEVFNPYHLDAALGEIAIICGGFFGVRPRIRSGSRFDHAMR